MIRIDQQSIAGIANYRFIGSPDVQYFRTTNQTLPMLAPPNQYSLVNQDCFKDAITVSQTTIIV